MPILWGNHVTVECDDCGKTEELAIAPLACGGIVVDEDAAADEGWDIQEEQVLCAPCSVVYHVGRP